MGDFVSEFGTGFAYCLGLFLCHSEREEVRGKGGDYHEAHMWFYGAVDHLFELQVPDIFSDEKKAEIQAFRDRCIKYRWGTEATWENVTEEIQNAKDFLRQFDEALGIISEKGEWE